MARAGFYNENEYRDYPFLDQTTPRGIVVEDLAPESSSLSSLSSLSSVSSESSSSASEAPLLADDLPEEAIVDFGGIMGLDARFNDEKHWVYLYRISRFDPYFVYEFRTNAPGALQESLVFVRNRLEDGQHAVQWATSTPIGAADPIPSDSSESSESAASGPSESSSEPYPFCEEESLGSEALDCGGPGCDGPAWEGFMVTGLFDALEDLLLDTHSIIYDPQVWVIEPGRIQNLSKTFVRSVNLANTDRTRTTDPAGCSDSSDSAAYGEGTVFVHTVCLQGAVRFKEGYNCAIRQEDNNNALVIGGAAGGGGDGEPCEEVPLFPGEEKPAGSPFFSGGPACGDVVTSINGKTGRNLRIDAGPGFRINVASGDPHTLIVNATLDDFALCIDNDFESSASC